MPEFGLRTPPVQNTVHHVSDGRLCLTFSVAGRLICEYRKRMSVTYAWLLDTGLVRWRGTFRREQQIRENLNECYKSADLLRTVSADSDAMER